MPRGDKSGPNGEGPMTGRKAGFCTGNNFSGYESSRGNGFRRNSNFIGSRGGGRRGFRNMFFATGQPGRLRSGNFTVSKEDEKTILSQEAENLKTELQDIESRIEDLNREE